MSFILRRIAVTRTGKVIPRDRPLPGERITIGRDGSNVIAVPDLAVNPHHATLESPDGRHVRVTAQEGLGFDWNGRTVDVADIDSANGGELRFGGHRLTIARENDAIILLVERVDDLSQSSKDVDEISAFSLQGRLPGKRLGAWAFALLTLAAFLIGPIWAWHHWRGVDERPAGYHADEAWLSGPLSVGHASLKNDCQSCHVEPFVAVTDTACVSCHTGEHKAMSASHANASTAMLLAARAPERGFDKFLTSVATTFNKPQGRCVGCHTEHDGDGWMPDTPQSECAACHTGMKARLAAAGHRTTLADASDFGIEHPEFRPLVRPAPGAKLVRASTANPRDFNGLKFPHDLHLRATGGVARMAASFRGEHGFGTQLECKNCHVPQDDGVRFKPVDMESQCSMCHSLAFEQIGGVTRTLRHGKPDQVAADLAAFYRSTPPSRPLQLGGMARRRPGAYAEGQVYNIYFREVAVRPQRADDAVRAVFSRGGACYDCHTVYAPTAGRGWSVAQVDSKSRRYYAKGWFSHANKGHKSKPCKECHLPALTSSSSTDLLVTGLRECRDCHVGGDGDRLFKTKHPATASPCAMCHEYHSDGGKPWRPKGKRGDVSAVTARPPSGLYRGRTRLAQRRRRWRPGRAV